MTSRQGNAFVFCSSHQLPLICLGPLKCFLSWHGALKDPRLSEFFLNNRETSTLSGVARLAWRSQDTVKNHLHKPWLCVCWKSACVHWSKNLRGLFLPWPPWLWEQRPKDNEVGMEPLWFSFLGRLHTHSRATLCELWEDIMWCLPPAVISMCCFCLLLLPLIHKFIHCVSNVYAFTDQHFHLDCFLWS